jgi:hypothetical protein
MENLVDLLITGAILGVTALTVYLKKRTKNLMENPDKEYHSPVINGSTLTSITRSEFDTFELRVESKLEKLEEKIDRLVFVLIEKKS